MAGLEEIEILDKEISLQLFRITQEAVSNALKHAHCRNVVISMKVHDRMLILMIQDDGIGIPTNSMINPSGMGIQSMHYRANSLRGQLDIFRKPEGGTDVTLLLPLSHKNASSRSRSRS